MKRWYGKLLGLVAGALLFRPNPLVGALPVSYTHLDVYKRQDFGYAPRDFKPSAEMFG